jgi:glycosyltransferase involved in cell wall biosynthesis
VVTAPSRFNLEKHLGFGFFTHTRREVVPNACDGDLPESLAPGPSDGAVQGLFLAQFDAHKGLPELLVALRSILEKGPPPRLRVAFAGYGAMQEQVEALCARYPQQLRFHGRVSGEEKTALIRSSSYMLIPSTCHDNFPRTMLDAFMHGLPVIGADRGGIPEVVENGVTGRILEPEPEAIARAILEYTQDDELRRRHGDAAFARAADYTLEKQIDRFLGIYEKVTGGVR